MIEPVVAEQFINGKLRSDPTLAALLGDGTEGVFTDTVDVSAAYPVVQIVYYDGDDLYHLGNAHIWADLTYIVRAVVLGKSYTPAIPIAQRIDAVLDNTTGTTTDGEVFAVARIRHFRMSEDTGERPARHLGAFYRIFAKES